MLHEVKQWPVYKSPKLVEVREKRVIIAVTLSPSWILSNNSTWVKLYRVLAYIKRFCFNSRQELHSRALGPLSMDGVNAAQR